jgi:hypothetical protein
VSAWNCSGSASSFSGSGVTWTSAFPAGEAGADGIISSLSQITGGPDSGCASSNGIILGINSAGAAQTCAWNVSYSDYGAEGGSSGNPTVASTLLKTGDLVAVSVWCITSCTVTSVTVGSDTATVTGVTGTSNANSGQPFIYYDLSTGVKGSQTITANITGTRSHSQVAYHEFVPGKGCTASHDVDASLGTGTGTGVNTPSITTPAGELIFNFTAVQSHTTNVNSPLGLRVLRRIRRDYYLLLCQYPKFAIVHSQFIEQFHG